MQYTAIPNKQRALPAIFTNQFVKMRPYFLLQISITWWHRHKTQNWHLREKNINLHNINSR